MLVGLVASIGVSTSTLDDCSDTGSGGPRRQGKHDGACGDRHEASPAKAR
jgi:hypothetical protein